MKVFIKRTKQDDFQTLGELTIPDAGFSCKTLELPWKINERRESCIPAGTYQVEKRFSDKFKHHFHILDVPDGDFILIHHGNFKKDVKGCILVDHDFFDLDSDGPMDVTSSKKTMAALNEILPDDFELEIGSS